MPAFVTDPISLSVLDASQVGEARRAAATLATTIGFDEQRQAEVAIVVTELATNLARHAKGGELVLRSLCYEGKTACGIEIISIDRGPGITNLNEAFRDGYSSGSGGTPGNGIGAIRRLSATFDIFTQAPAGTVLVSRLWQTGAAPPPLGHEVGLVCLPKKGETACGDATEVRYGLQGRTVVLLSDGLGHGVQAAEASRQATKVFREHSEQTTPQIVEALHSGLRGTRGAAVMVLELWLGPCQVRCTGVGNIAAAIVTDGKPRSMISHNGTAGMEARRIQEFVYPWPADSLIVAHSDGLGSHWQLGAYPGLRFRHPSVIAGVLYRDFRRERDDVTVMVIGRTPTAGQP